MFISYDNFIENLKKEQVKLGLTINPKNKDRGDQNFFDKIDTEEKAYWLGFIY